MNTMKWYIDEEYSINKNIIENYEKNMEVFKDLIKKTKAKKWIVLGTGSSYNSILSSKNYIENISSISIEIKEPYNYFMYEKTKPEDELVIAVTQRGTSYSTIEAIKKVQKNSSIPCIALTSILDSPITQHVDTIIDIGCGKETMPYSTKGVSATILSLFLMGVVAAEALEEINQYSVSKKINQFAKMVDFIPSVISKCTNFYEKNKKDFKDVNRISTIGYGPNVGTVKEAETKFTETIRVPTHGQELEAYMHGPIFELKDSHHLFFTDVSNSGPEKRSKLLNDYLSKYCSNIYTITTGPNTENPKQLGLDIDVDESISPLLLIIPYQIFSHYISLTKGIDLTVPVYKDFKEVMQSKVNE